MSHSVLERAASVCLEHVGDSSGNSSQGLSRFFTGEPSMIFRAKVALAVSLLVTTIPALASFALAQSTGTDAQMLEPGSGVAARNERG